MVLVPKRPFLSSVDEQRPGHDQGVVDVGDAVQGHEP